MNGDSFKLEHGNSHIKRFGLELHKKDKGMNRLRDEKDEEMNWLKHEEDEEIKRLREEFQRKEGMLSVSMSLTTV